MDETKDIWIRDFLPIQTGKDQFVQFTLTKDYYLKKDRHKATDPAPICTYLGIDPITPIYNSMPIYLDGGNVIRGYGKAIMTDKVFKDNGIAHRIDQAAFANILKEVLRVEQIIFIPGEPYDQTKHADGMVRFVDSKTVVANDFATVNVSQSFRERFYGTLSGSGLDVLAVPYHHVNDRKNGYQSARGCYINYLQVEEKIFIPTFDDPTNDAVAIKRFGEIFGPSNIIPVPSIEIAMGGGVLNCLSWEILA
ncbi:MAG: agmatine deiminase family protein [Bacteroidota bacterium]